MDAKERIERSTDVTFEGKFPLFDAQVFPMSVDFQSPLAKKIIVEALTGSNPIFSTRLDCEIFCGGVREFTVTPASVLPMNSPVNALAKRLWESTGEIFRVPSSRLLLNGERESCGMFWSGKFLPRLGGVNTFV